MSQMKSPLSKHTKWKHDGEDMPISQFWWQLAP